MADPIYLNLTGAAINARLALAASATQPEDVDQEPEDGSMAPVASDALHDHAASTTAHGDPRAAHEAAYDHTALATGASLTAEGIATAIAGDAEAAATLRDGIGLSAGIVDALAGASDLSGANAVVSVDRLFSALETYANTEVVDIAVSNNTLTLDFQGRTRLVGRVSLTDDVTDIVVANLPGTGYGFELEAYLEIAQATPSGTTYDIDYLAWAGLTTESGGMWWDGAYHIYQDATPTRIELRSLDGGTTWTCWGNPPSILPPVAVGSSRALTAADVGRTLVCTTAVTLTPIALAWPDEIHIQALSGAVTFAESGGVTIASSGSKKILAANSDAVLSQQHGEANVVRLVGGLQ